ncbi:hypothetical protein BKA56DRAFT_589400 [Ilyonectria sp. MPI-CAGE-AT-0026]|nr:hypothetical protein BKA56DRAFT_607000 [Ilyonectria sp. MPI-CAGE-AT-0026]KAH6950425.1 hypothetical protein BKA56DRAFT_606505 [Ilyonectria sp. MPI-CAGE-AT-0026]KAH6953691.1 hypothetical protein BKA56DRAFT_604608 [Ilyonectria sp. MPI-CAGE-AT-0026]KAH6953701.1 hypothetical protein BKA56DRAFT_604658 [Ilyonectria sp. MPI-CAGE-AT-0026]KAH6956052.1 hypothetical protein BKA56DRAFT_602891 [Ilyonectria sp. MPI-CAGE-AT-0026]
MNTPLMRSVTEAYIICDIWTSSSNVSYLAIDVLSVPAMARLSADTVEKVQCLSNWVKNDLIRKVYVAVDDEVMEVASDDGDISGPPSLYYE